MIETTPAVDAAKLKNVQWKRIVQMMAQEERRRSRGKDSPTGESSEQKRAAKKRR